VKEGVFAFYLGADSPGELTIGGVNHDRYEGELHYTQLKVCVFGVVVGLRGLLAMYGWWGVGAPVLNRSFIDTRAYKTSTPKITPIYHRHTYIQNHPSKNPLSHITHTYKSKFRTRRTGR
jgi:hypothetical protein